MTLALLGAVLTVLAPTSSGAFALRSDAFTAGAAIPRQFTCQGDDRSPPLAWSGAPAGTRSFALIVDDPDAPDPAHPRPTPWVHWVVYNLPADASALAAGAALPSGARAGRSDRGQTAYHGPCPPIGRHRYVFTLYALDTVLPDLGAPTAAALRDAMRGHVLGTAELIGVNVKRA
ncbi:MAG: YbhB/YbcL family Raf kinase inhibitor-like protein [Deltaproteobacteria bacterium]|nr:YbhB/YbcL family Raf kinase inhibitor-like protein [Deltaproteobacteria bacterium]